MITTRLISRFPSRFLHSVFAGHRPYRNIESGPNEVTFGNIGGGDSITDVQRAMLDVFLGKWQLDTTTYHKSYQPITRADVKLLSNDNPKLSTSLTFKENNGMWTFEIGAADSSNTMTLTCDFKLGVDFVMMYPNGKFMQTVIYPEGRLMLWEQQNLDIPSDMLRIITEVKGRRLIWKTRYPDGTKLLKKYVKK